jgi:hypothetical protein
MGSGTGPTSGQIKPPFSTSWWTPDNNVNFLKRGSSTPVYPYFDRGLWLWGDVLNKTLTWNISAWTGAGLELDYARGDIDSHKDIVARIFFSPFKNKKGHVLEGLHLALQGTYSNQSTPTSRFETKGMSTSIRDDKMWKWQTEQSYSKVRSDSGTDGVLRLIIYADRSHAVQNTSKRSIKISRYLINQQVQSSSIKTAQFLHGAHG